MAIYQKIWVTDLWGQSFPVSLQDLATPSSILANLAPLPAEYAALNIVGCRMTRTGGNAFYYLRGTIQEIAAKFDTASANETDNVKTYVPTITSSGAGALAVIGPWYAWRQDGRVFVKGAFSFNPAVAGTPETISITLPLVALGAGWAPDANFNAVSDITGVIGPDGNAAADFVATGLRAESGGVRAQVVLDQTTASAVEYGVFFSYEQDQ